jgi:hypothetical protein
MDAQGAMPHGLLAIGTGDTNHSFTTVSVWHMVVLGMLKFFFAMRTNDRYGDKGRHQVGMRERHGGRRTTACKQRWSVDRSVLQE